MNMIGGSRWEDKILERIYEKPWRFGEITEKLEVTPSTLDRHLKDFLKRGLVEKKYDPKESAVKYELTEKGLKYMLMKRMIRTLKKRFEEGRMDDIDFLSILEPDDDEMVGLAKDALKAESKEEIVNKVNKLKKQREKELESIQYR